jgi:hypothetical protein
MSAASSFSGAHVAASMLAGPTSTELPVTNVRRQPRRNPSLRHPSPNVKRWPRTASPLPVNFPL